MDDDTLARIHEWLGAAMSPPSDALEAQIRRRLNSELCRVEYWYPNGSVGIKGPSIRTYGNTIYDAVLEYLKDRSNGQR